MVGLARRARLRTAKPWRLDSSIDSTDSFSLGGSYRVRYETLNHPIVPARRARTKFSSDTCCLNARVTLRNFYANVELEDSRQELADSGSALGADSVNTFEPLQALIGMRDSMMCSPGGRLDGAGRMTIDLGSRRLAARNNFRNTINWYTGVHALWKSADGFEARAFYVEPVQRKPSDPRLLAG